MLDEVPAELIKQIQDHILAMCTLDDQAWASVQDDEDTATGDLFGRVRGKSSQSVLAGNAEWRWEVTYKRIRPKVEKPSGGDGILQIRVIDVSRGHTEYKGLLFQSKTEKDKDHKRLLDQVKKLETIHDNASAVFQYRPNASRAVEATKVIAAAGNLSQVPADSWVDLAEYLAKRFVGCLIGVRGLFYDEANKRYVFPDKTDGVITLIEKVGHLIDIVIERIEQKKDDTGKTHDFIREGF